MVFLDGFIGLRVKALCKWLAVPVFLTRSATFKRIFILTYRKEYILTLGLGGGEYTHLNQKFHKSFLFYSCLCVCEKQC